MSQWGTTFRPPQVPQQPPQFFTTTQAPGAVASYTWQQQAAYFRQHVEILQPPPYFVTQPPVVTQPFVPLRVPAPPRREQTAEAIALVRNRTGTDPVGAVPPRPPDQANALWRPVPQVPQQRPVVFTVTVAQPFVPPPPAQLMVPSRWDATAIYAITTRLVTSAPPVYVPPAVAMGFAPSRQEMAPLLQAIRQVFVPPIPGVVPPVPPSQQAAAYQRWRPEILQTSYSFVFPASAPSTVRVQAVQPGLYNGVFREVGDVFDLLSANDLSDSTVSIVPPGNPNYPLYGWMKVVDPNTRPLFSWALWTGQGYSATVVAGYAQNAAGEIFVYGNRRRYVD